MINSREIHNLHPTLQKAVKELKKRTKKHLDNNGWKLGITCTYRDYEYQNKLYAQGRTTAGKKVTNARGGYSMHNFRLAFDVHNNVKGDLYPFGFLEYIGKIWTEMGGDWGGNWNSFKDKPHFQFTAGLTTSALRQGRTLDKNIKMKWESDETVKKEADEVIEEFEIKVDDEVKNITRILKENTNFLPAREFGEMLGYNVSYDKVKKMPVFTKK
ncbi:MAG: M15 family metallopeptidase [Lachnospirales bacterium]